MSTHLPDLTVWMHQPDLAGAPRYPMPDGYRMRFYRDGDLHTWVRVQQASEPYFVPNAEHFERSMPGDTARRTARVMFLVDPAGADIGTITAWDNEQFLGRPVGQIHWVAIVPEARGRGLAKPMLSVACEALRAHGHREACLDTDTRRVAALSLYRHFGFVPRLDNDALREAWATIEPLLRP